MLVNNFILKMQIQSNPTNIQSATAMKNCGIYSFGKHYFETVYLPVENGGSMFHARLCKYL